MSNKVDHFEYAFLDESGKRVGGYITNNIAFDYLRGTAGFQPQSKDDYMDMYVVYKDGSRAKICFVPEDYEVHRATANTMFDELRRWLLENSVKAKDIGPMVASYWAGWDDAINGVSRKIAAITGSDREPNRCANCKYSTDSFGKMRCM